MAERSTERRDMAEFLSSVCAICLEALRDGRLLECLHSFCRRCVDDLEMRTGQEHTITCPVCRSPSRLPESGTSGLPRDITVVMEAKCECCISEGGEGKPEVSCTTCELTFCREHALPHAFATGHGIIPIGKDAASSSCTRPAGTSSSARLCDEHGLPVRYFCQECSVSVCGDCSVLGKHHNHRGIVLIKDLAKDVQQRVRRKTAELKSVRFPEVKKLLSAVQDVSRQISSRAESVRAKIRSSAKRVHEAVDLVTEQKLAEVDDLEELRLKHLHCQHDELKQHADGLKSVIDFSEKVLEADVETEDAWDVLLAVEKRAGELGEALLAEKPIEHAHMDLKSVSKEMLLVKVGELVGIVVPCHASAKHSVVEGETKKSCSEGTSVSFVLLAKDQNKRRMAIGGDVIRVESHQTSVGACTDLPGSTIVDNDNGTYTITFTAKRCGDYSFEVCVNNVKLQQCLSVICQPSFTLDPDTCGRNMIISEDRKTVTLTGSTGCYPSVLSTCGMQTGQHTWKVKVTKSKKLLLFLGVVEKRGRDANKDSYNSSYSWYGDGQKCVKGRLSHPMSQWRVNDVLQLDLNCDDHTLSITNARSRETDTITNLPPRELFAYFSLYGRGSSLTIVP